MLMKFVLVICLLYIGVDTVFGKGLRLSKREAEVIKNLNTESIGRRVKKGGQNDGPMVKQANGLSNSRESLLMYAKHMYETRNGLINPQKNVEKQKKDKPEPLLIRSKRRNLEQPESTNHLLAREKRLSSRDHSKNPGHHHNSHSKNIQHRMKGNGNSHNDELKIAKESLSDIEQKHSKLAIYKKKGDMSRRVGGKKNEHKGKREDKRHHNNDHHKKMKAFKKINKKKHDDHKAEHHNKSGHTHGKAKNFNKWKNHENKSAFHKNKNNKKHLSHKNQDLTIVKRKDIKF